MDTSYYSQFLGAFGGSVWLFFAMVVWVFIWKGLALWKAAHRNEKWWFVALLIINTLGLLELLYLYVITPWMDSRKAKKGTTPQV